MITWFLSKNKKRLTTVDELVNVILEHKDLLYKEGNYNIGGIQLYCYTSDDEVVKISYGSEYIILTPIRWVSDRVIQIVIPSCNLECELHKDHVLFQSKDNEYHKIPPEAFSSDVDFFQYTLLNFTYTCSDSTVLKLIKFFMEFTNEQS